MNLEQRIKIIDQFQIFCKEKYNIEFGDIASDEIIEFIKKAINNSQG